MTTLLVKQRKYLHLVTNHARKNRAMHYEQGRWFSSLLRCAVMMKMLLDPNFFKFCTVHFVEYPVFVGFHWEQFLLKEASLQLNTKL